MFPLENINRTALTTAVEFREPDARICCETLVVLWLLASQINCLTDAVPAGLINRITPLMPPAAVVFDTVEIASITSPVAVAFPSP